MLGVLVNTLTVLLGSTLGILFHRAIPKKISDAVMHALALGLNLLGVTRLKVANMLPAMLLAPLFTYLTSLL